MRPIAALALAIVLAAGCKAKPEPAPAEPEAGLEVDETTGDEMQEPVKEPVPDGPLLGTGVVHADGGAEARRLNSVGLTMLRKDLVDRAAGKFGQALEKDPGYAAAAYNLACALARQGEHARSVEMLERAMLGAFPRFGHKIDEDRDLETLRQGAHWPGVIEKRTAIAQAWREALASPGTFVLVSEIQKLTDPYGYLIHEEDDQRGTLWFHHEASGRFLPLSSGRVAAGFVLDREAGAVHVLQWNRQIMEADTIPAQYTGISVVTVDLDDLTGTKAVVPGSATGLILYVHDGGTYLRRAWFQEALAREYWITSTIHEGTIEQVSKVETEPTPIDLCDGEWTGGDEYCASRIGEQIPAKSYLQLDTFCGSAFPEPGARWTGDGAVGEDEIIQASTL
jgi:hypothetical protein